MAARGTFHVNISRMIYSPIGILSFSSIFIQAIVTAPGE